jgi:pyruvate dehydrogenase E1 component beta subunit
VLYETKGDVPEEPYALPFGEASVVRDGSDVTVVALGRMVLFAQEAAEALEGEGISCEIVDPRTTSPLDEDTIIESVENTGRLVVVDEANPRCGMACDIVGRVAQEAFAELKAPPRMVTAPHTPVPFSPVLEDAYVPTAESIAAAVRETAGFGAPAPA